MAREEILGKYSWMNSALFETILKNPHKEDYIKIEQFDVEPALKCGENYSSYLVRARVEYSDKNGNYSKHLMIKIGLGEQLTRTRDVFAKEAYLYQEILPTMENILDAAHIPTKFAPKFYGGDLKQSYLIMEDLQAANYNTIARSQGLNYNQLKRCLKSLASWHAASVKILENNTLDIYDLYVKPHVSLTGSKAYRILFENALTSCSEAFAEFDDFSDIVQKLNQLQMNGFEKCCAAVERNESSFNVLTHGDLWSNNILFHLTDDEPEPIFVDFQMSYFGSPMLDISYLLFSSPNESITSVEFEQLLDYYCDQLIDTLKTLDIPTSKIPNKQQLYDDFNTRGCYGAFFCLFIVPLRHYLDTNNDGVQKFLSKTEEGSAFRREIFADQQAQKILANLLRYFNKKQFLN